MKEQVQEVKTFEVSLVCECGSMCTDTEGGAKDRFEYRCIGCGKVTSSSEKYPKIVYKYADDRISDWWTSSAL